MMTVSDLLKIYECGTITELAARMNVSRQAIHTWQRAGKIPEDRELRIRYAALMVAGVAREKVA